MNPHDHAMAVVAPVEWVTDIGAIALFGLNRTRLSELRHTGEIRWKKIPTRDGRTGGKARVLMNAQSIREWIARQPDGVPFVDREERHG